ncbi:MAG: tetratricopeptide repeat protein [Calditrichia bacterium]
MKSIQIYSLVLLACFLGSTAIAQNQQPTPEARKKAMERQQLRLAQNYQRRNEHQSAVKLLVPLYQKNPGSLQIYQELLESYGQLALYTEALALIESQKQAAAPNPRYDVDYGGILFKSDRKEEAMGIWREVLKEHGKNVGVFTMVANKMLVNRLYEEAIEMFKEAYKQHPKKHFLLREIANFYQRRLDYENALDYYLRFVKEDRKNYEIAMRQLLSMKIEPERIHKVVKQMRTKTQKYKKVQEVQIVAAKFYQKYRRYDDALATYRKLENDKTKGRFLIDFGRAVQNDSLYELALKAYDQAIEQFPNSRSLLPAYLGAATCNLELARKNNDQEYAGKSIRMIEKVRSNYPKHPQLPQMILLEGDIHREFFFDLDRAIGIYEAIAKDNVKNEKLFSQATLRAGESYIIKGDLKKAGKTLEPLLTKTNAEQQAYALLLKGRIAFYDGDYDGAAEMLDKVLQLQGFSGTATNDALNLQMLLVFKDQSVDALREYARADQLLFSRKKSEAVSKLQNALDKNPEDAFRIRILLEAAHLSSESGRHAEALEYCKQVLQDNNLATYADQALFFMASVLENKLNDLPQAYKLYDQLLSDYPASRHVAATRERLKTIRQENPDIVQ